MRLDAKTRAVNLLTSLRNAGQAAQRNLFSVGNAGDWVISMVGAIRIRPQALQTEKGGMMRKLLAFVLPVALIGYGSLSHAAQPAGAGAASAPTAERPEIKVGDK